MGTVIFLIIILIKLLTLIYSGSLLVNLHLGNVFLHLNVEQFLNIGCVIRSVVWVFIFSMYLLLRSRQCGARVSGAVIV